MIIDKLVVTYLIGMVEAWALASTTGHSPQLRWCSDLFFLVFCLTCTLIIVFRIYVSLLLMRIALLGWVLCNPITYNPRKCPQSRDSAAWTADRESQSPGPPIFLTSVNTPSEWRSRGLVVIPIYTQKVVKKGWKIIV